MSSPMTSTPMRAHLSPTKSVLRRSRVPDASIRLAYLKSEDTISSSFCDTTVSDNEGHTNDYLLLPMLFKCADGSTSGGESDYKSDESPLPVKMPIPCDGKTALAAAQCELKETKAVLWIARQIIDGKSRELNIWRAAPKCRQSSLDIEEEYSGEALIEKWLRPPKYKTRARADDGQDRRARLDFLKAKFAPAASKSLDTEQDTSESDMSC
ncbi:hypothetical protein CBOM_01074 [Ceraceosorus bombacis]|uniref:Uncharacterized protein n=1 Tax=Ceraceosorus bombacis TaxID=401625 RepID=A0A0P1BAP9_9BASI|nr:hypothetical protein CBOM_01074 [Ceraceosorus bombacis]